jgi:serine protease inhibitor
MHKKRIAARPRQIYLDRPFVYMLVNLETNTPLFIGTLTAIPEQ